MAEPINQPDRDDDDDAIDAFEAELASFEPRPLSPTLRHAIGEDLSPQRPRLRITPVLAGLAAAACVTIAFVAWRGDGGNHVVTNPPLPAPHVPTAHTVITDPTAPPTVSEYQRAFARSPQAFDALLARPAGRGGRGAGEGGDVVTAFSRSASILNQTDGDSL